MKIARSDCWNPQQYQKFSKERMLPFYDLIELIKEQKEMSVVDLGCGTGELTRILHDTMKAKETLGIDSSSVMLKESEKFRAPNIEFKLIDIDDFAPSEKFDLIFSNAALQWVPNHRELFKRLSGYLSEQGQIAIQMPANFDYPTHSIARDLAKEQPFRSELETGREPSVLTMEEYAKILYSLGLKKQIVRMQVYPHILESTESVVEWVKGSLLTYYQSRLSEESFQLFLEKYREKLIAFLGDNKPFFLPFKRIFLWAEKGN